VNRFELFFHVADAGDRQNEVVTFIRHHEHAHGPDEDCGCGGYDIDCVASAEWPGVYHGTLDMNLDALLDDFGGECGFFRFPARPGPITSLFIVCGYEPAEHEERWLRGHGMLGSRFHPRRLESGH
jgi:hypothetical protein